ncbi:unnamed protein product, partial [Prorocentrum cordatum]
MASASSGGGAPPPCQPKPRAKLKQPNDAPCCILRVRDAPPRAAPDAGSDAPAKLPAPPRAAAEEGTGGAGLAPPSSPCLGQAGPAEEGAGTAGLALASLGGTGGAGAAGDDHADAAEPPPGSPGRLDNGHAAVAAANLSCVAAEIAREFDYADVSAAVAWSLVTGRRLLLEFERSSLQIPGELFAEAADAMGRAGGDVQASVAHHPDEAPLRLGVGWISRHDGDCTELHHASSLADLVGKTKGIHFFPVYVLPGLQSFSPRVPCDGSKCGGRGFPCSSRLASNLSTRGLSMWPVLADGDCLPRSVLWCRGAPDTKETRLAERAKVASFLASQAASPACCAAWALAMGRLAALSSGAHPAGPPALALASAGEGAQDDGARDSETAAFVHGICNVAGLNPTSEMPDAGIVLGMTPLGRRKKAPLFREMLFQWFCSYRGTVKGRILPETLIDKAKHLRAKYIAEHLETNQAAPPRIDVPKITSHWLKDWRTEYHVSLRTSNKRWKVPRWMWKERVKIYWCNLLRLRRKTSAWKGEDVEIVENHGHTRERWTAMTMCATDQLRASAVPPAELLFKGGPIVLGRLQEELEEARTDNLSAAHKVTVQVSPSASYATAEVLEFMRKHLEPLRPGREWRIASLDVYGPHQAKELIDVCWEHGYVGPALVAPGTTGSLQGNDTHLHGPFSGHYQHNESVTISAKQEADPASMGSMTHRDCIRCFCSVWDNPDMHKRASAFGVHNMARGSLDGKQNRLGEATLQGLWDELNMEKLKRQCLAEVDEEYDRGNLPWAKETIALLVTVYPKRGCLDRYLPGQDDEGECVDQDNDTPWGDVLPQEDPQEAIVAADEEEVRTSGLPSSSTQGAAETSAQLERAQCGVSKVESVDIMIEHARASGRHSLQAYLERERLKLLKQLTGAKQENPAVAEAVLGRLRFDEHERQRRAEEARKHRADTDAARGVEAKLREHACRLALAEREVARRQAEEQRRKAVEHAAVHLEPQMFSAAVAGIRAAQHNRWKAFERVMLVGAALSPEQERNLRHDWQKWDAFESHQNPHGNDWANMFKAHLSRLLDHCRSGNADRIQ